MAKAKATTRARAKEPGTPSRIDPATLPNEYGMIVEGTCMSPDFEHGATLIFSRSEGIKVGDVVAVWWRPEVVEPGELQVTMKRLAMAPPPWVTFPYREHPESEIEAICFLESTSPRRQFAIKCRDVLAIHKCTGRVKADEGRAQ